MPLDFPNSPNVNDTYTSGTRTWQWNGVSWGLTASGLVGPTGPTGPAGDWASAQIVNAQTGTSYNLIASDIGKLVTLNNSSAITLNVNTGLGLTAGQRVDILQLGTGQVTVAGTATINGTPGLKLRARYSAGTILCTAVNTYILLGDLSA